MNEGSTSLDMRLLTLLHRVREEGDEPARTELNALLRESAEARKAMARLLVDEQALMSHLRDKAIVALIEPKPVAARNFSTLHAPLRKFVWRGLTAAVAGLMVGIFCTSLVWAYAMPRESKKVQRSVPIFDESFEDPKIVPHRGFPTRPDEWFGDLSGGIPAEMAVQPKDGERMVRLPPVSPRKFSYAGRIVDLAAHPLPAGAESRQLEVTASFHGLTTGTAERYQIRLAAFVEEPGDVKAVWHSSALFDQVLQHVGRTIITKPDETGWKTLTLTIDIPPAARSLVIYLGAGMGDDAAPKTVHYLDDVHARFILKDSVH